MSRTTWRALRTELLRSTAPVAAVATLVLGTILLYSEANSWAGRWMPFAAAVRFSTMALAPVAVGFGAWQGGRERRRRLGEQLESTPRPRWQPLVLAWAGVTLGCWLGLLLVVAAGAALVAPVATYAGGGWWGLLSVTPVALTALTAVGIALGRVVRFWLVAPIAAIVVYGLQVYAHDTAWRLSGAEWLAPVVAVYHAFGQTLSGWVHLQQALWFGGLAATGLVLAGARRRWLAILPAAVAVAGAASLLGGPPFQHWQPDPAATELVCTEDEQVCLAREQAFLLDDVTPAAREALARFEGVPGGPTRAIGAYAAPPGAEPHLDIDPTGITITGQLGPDGSAVRWWPELACESPAAADDRYFWMLETAMLWASGDQPDPTWAAFAPAIANGYHALLAMPQPDQKGWIGELIAAAGSCDRTALDRLAEQLA